MQILRNAGYAAHTNRVEDDEDLLAALEKKVPDVVLYSMGMELISLEDTVALLEKQLGYPVPVIAVKKPGQEAFYQFSQPFDASPRVRV